MKDHHELAMEEHARRATWMQETGGYAKDMTLRDHYAGLAMQGLIARTDWDTDNLDFYSAWAHEMADAMLAAREGK
jgi:hypothetical protein